MRAFRLASTGSPASTVTGLPLTVTVKAVIARLLPCAR
jgi:hypothetical protein